MPTVGTVDLGLSLIHHRLHHGSYSRLQRFISFGLHTCVYKDVYKMAFGWIVNIGKAVELPRVFFHPELRLPKYHSYGELEESFEDKCKSFLDAYAQLLTEEETGRVANTTVIQVIAAAWKLKRCSFSVDLAKEPVVKAMIKTTVPELVRKYGMTRLWKAGYADTFQRRVEEELGDDSTKSFRCARCGRALSADLSIKRGLGPVCVHKIGVPVQRS